MFFKRNKVQVVQPGDYTDYSERFEQLEKMRAEEGYATRRDVAIIGIPTVVGASTFAIGTKMMFESAKIAEAQKAAISEPINVLSQAPIPEPSTMIETFTPLAVNAIPINTIPQHTGFIADKSLEVLATALDPLVQILVAISFPIASVIMVGACFFFMFGNSEKAWNMIMNAGLGYVLIQLSPLFLQILREVGEAV